MIVCMCVCVLCVCIVLCVCVTTCRYPIIFKTENDHISFHSGVTRGVTEIEIDVDEHRGSLCCSLRSGEDGANGGKRRVRRLF